MRNILVAIDFSEASFNAVSYATFLANVFKTPLTLAHALNGTSSFEKQANGKIYDSPEELKAANEKFLKKEIERIVRKFTVKINGVVMKGNPVKVLNEIAEINHSDLIVMGMKGKGESNSKFGSVTASMIDKTSIPLLVVPKNALYRTINSITLTTDFKDEKLPAHFSILEKMVVKFDPFIQVLNVQKENPKLKTEAIAEKMSKGLKRDKYNHSFNVIERDNVEDGIFRFLRKHPTDLLVMVTRKRGFINKFFTPSHTKKVSVQTKIPLLVLHDYNA